MTSPKSARQWWIGIGLAVTVAATAGGAVFAAEFPTRPIKLIVPWPAGGATDVVMRVFAEAANKHLAHPVVIENKPGAAGTLGPGAMAMSARPDGHTISQIPISIFRHPFMRKTDFDPLKDFTYIIHLTGYTFGVVVRADSPWKTWDEFIAHAQANPGKVAYGTPGVGTSLHITMEQIAEARGLRWLHTPYKGSAETTRALLVGEIAAVADSSGWAAHVESGQFRLLVTWGEQRTKRFPDAPTLKELGYGIVSTSPYGIGGPKGMDAKVVKILHDAFRRALDDSAVLAVLDRYDQQPEYLSSDDYATFVKATVEHEKVAVQKLGLKAE